MSNFCLWCKKTVEVFRMIRYTDLAGFCSDQCIKDQLAREKALKEADSKMNAYTDFSSAISHVPRRR